MDASSNGSVLEVRAVVATRQRGRHPKQAPIIMHVQPRRGTIHWGMWSRHERANKGPAREAACVRAACVVRQSCKARPSSKPSQGRPSDACCWAVRVACLHVAQLAGGATDGSKRRSCSPRSPVLRRAALAPAAPQHTRWHPWACGSVVVDATNATGCGPPARHVGDRPTHGRGRVRSVRGRYVAGGPRCCLALTLGSHARIWPPPAWLGTACWSGGPHPPLTLRHGPPPA